MEIKQINEQIKEQEAIINKATKKLSIYEEMLVLTQALREVESGVTTPKKKVPAAKTLKVPAVHPEVADGIKEIAKGLKLGKPSKGRATKGKKKKQVKSGVPIIPFVHEAMGYMPKNFTSSDLLEISSNCIKIAHAQVTHKQIRSAVHGFLYGASNGKMKTNPYPLTYTGKKDTNGQMIYQRAVVTPKNDDAQ